MLDLWVMNRIKPTTHFAARKLFTWFECSDGCLCQVLTNHTQSSGNAGVGHRLWLTILSAFKKTPIKKAYHDNIILMKM